MQVSVRELKNRLSHYLRLVQQGESIVVTAHHTPLARLLPIPSVEPEGLRRLLTLEEVHWNGKKPSGGQLRPAIAGQTVAARVLEDRR
ncbi:MAG: type II toxin-antitoxin system Phd/YefM family antitoxin [Gammaproteobacteria bacterium]